MFISTFAHDYVQADAAQLMSDGLLSPTAYAQLDSEVSALCKTLGAKAIDLVEGFGIPEHLHHAPIAKDWAKYNSAENNGELTEANRTPFRDVQRAQHGSKFGADDGPTADSSVQMAHATSRNRSKSPFAIAPPPAPANAPPAA